ncbi:MAG: hypothetical protein NVSMB42_14600 [Herpetosiphon sp.]
MNEQYVCVTTTANLKGLASTDGDDFDFYLGLALKSGQDSVQQAGVLRRCRGGKTQHVVLGGMNRRCRLGLKGACSN